jgi:hypothetical protein
MDSVNINFQKWIKSRVVQRCRNWFQYLPQTLNHSCNPNHPIVHETMNELCPFLHMGPLWSLHLKDQSLGYSKAITCFYLLHMFYFTRLHAGEVCVCCNHMLIVRANVRGMGRRCVVVQLGWSFQYAMPCVLAASLHPPRYIHSLG